MKEITKVSYDYNELIETFEFETLIEIEEDDYEGSSFYLFDDFGKFGILVFGWGSCSGCDAFQEIVERPKDKILDGLKELRDELYNSITWRSRGEMVEYINSKDFTLEWYGYSSAGRKFVKELKNYSF